MIPRAPLPGRPSCLQKHMDVLMCYIPGEIKDQNTFIYVKSSNNLATANYFHCSHERDTGTPAAKIEWDRTHQKNAHTLRTLSETEIANVEQAVDARKRFLKLPATERSIEVKEILESRPKYDGSHNPFEEWGKSIKKKDG